MLCSLERWPRLLLPFLPVRGVCAPPAEVSVSPPKPRVSEGNGRREGPAFFSSLFVGVSVRPFVNPLGHRSPVNCVSHPSSPHPSLLLGATLCCAEVLGHRYRFGTRETSLKMRRSSSLVPVSFH